MVRHRLAHVFMAMLMVLLVVPAGAGARQGDLVLIEPLLEVSLPAASIPTGPIVVALNSWTWEPDATASVPTGAWAQGIVIDHVLSGSYAATSGGAVLLVHADESGPAEEVAPGTEFVLDAGDGVAYLQNEASWEFRNGGAEQGAGLGGGIFSTADADNPGTETEIGLELTELASTELDSWNAGVAESVTFAYWRATLAPGASIPAPPDGVVQLVAPEPETDPELTLTTSADGAVRNDGTAPIAVFGLTLAP